MFHLVTGGSPCDQLFGHKQLWKSRASVVIFKILISCPCKYKGVYECIQLMYCFTELVSVETTERVLKLNGPIKFLLDWKSSILVTMRVRKHAMHSCGCLQSQEQ